MTMRQILMAGSMAIFCTQPSASEIEFDRHQVDIGTAERKTVLTGHFLNGALADVAAIHIDGQGNRHLIIFAFDGSEWSARIQAVLQENVQFVDVARIEGHDRLITYAPGRFSWFDPQTSKERPLLNVNFDFNPAPEGLRYAFAQPLAPFDAGEIPLVEIFKDLNGDGLDDLVLPGPNGFSISLQTGDGAFTEFMKLGPPEPFRDEYGMDEHRRYRDMRYTALNIPWYLSRVHMMDHDLDGRSDLVFWNTGHFVVHYQDQTGGFSPEARTFSTQAQFDADGDYAILFGLPEHRLTVLHALRDINGDGISDLVTMTLSGRFLLRLRTRYAVYYGMQTAEGIEFPAEPDTVASPRAKAPLSYSHQWWDDVNADGSIDVFHVYVKTGVIRIISALMGKSVILGLELFSNDQGIYPKKGLTRRFKARLEVKEGTGRDAGFFPASMVGDVNGDGKADVLVTTSRDQLSIYPGESGPGLLAKEPINIAVRVPGDERNSWLADLNRDGSQDVIMHLPSTTTTHRVTLLISRK